MDTKLANELIPVSWLDLGTASTLGATMAVSLALFTLVWAIHVKMEDAGIVDFLWGGSFSVTGWLAVLLTGAATATTLLLMGFVTLWSIRLTIHMVWRHGHMDGEDARYRAMRDAGGPSFWWKSLFTVFWIQAVVQWLAAAPLLAAALVRAEEVSVPALVLGVVVFAVGLVVESIADHQLWSFKAIPANRGRLMTTGLFSWSRHPNYFGETLVWWGLALVAYASSASLLAFVGPALLTGLLIKVSGVSLLDAHLARTKPGYAEWAASTSAFVPRPPRPQLARPVDGPGPG